MNVEGRCENVGAGVNLNVFDLTAKRSVAQVMGFSPRSTFTAPSSGSYTIFIHSLTNETSGRCDVVVDGRTVLAGADFGGMTGAVASNVAFVYQTALLPGGASATFILGLDSALRVVAYDQNMGVSEASRIAQTAGISYVVIGTTSTSVRGRAVLYVNDPATDRDADGLGDLLEAELRTCSGLPGEAYCRNVFNPKDTDRDGIEDGLEVFGADSGRLYFPTWGSNPRHKDLFIEADFTSEFTQTPLNEEGIHRIQYHLSHAPAAHVVNPDLLDGVSVHIDAGIAPKAPEDVASGLYGNWGGSNMIPLVDWQAQRHREARFFDSARAPYFRQVLLLAAGGSAGFGSFFYATGTSPDTITHELGHTLGLQHESLVSGLNCSPAYPSIMSYATPHGTFLSGDGFPAEGINPSSLCEADGLGGQVSDLSFLQSIYGFPVDEPGKRVDWNRDGVFSGGTSVVPGTTSKCTAAQRVRAQINHSYSGCDTHTQNRREISGPIVAAGREDGGSNFGASSIARLGNRLYVFYVKRGASSALNRLFYRSALIGSKFTGGCTGGFKVTSNSVGDTCMNFEGPFE